MDDFNAKDHEIVSDLKEQIKRLELRLNGLESHGRADFSQDAAGFAEVEESSVGDNGDGFQLTNQNTIPKVRKCNFMEFKNRFSEKDGHYAIEALVSGVLLEQEILEEQKFRDRLFEQAKTASRVTKKKIEVLAKDVNHTMNALRNAQSDDTWIRRIRLQSPALLRTFAKVQGESWSLRPRTYYRPFCALIYFHPRMKEALAELEEKWSSRVEETPGRTPNRSVYGDEEEDSTDDSPAALEVLRCYVDFIDKEVIPDYNRFHNLDFSSDAKIRFSDLCSLFKPGDIIYRSVEGEIPGHRDARMGQRAWKVFGTDSSNKRYHIPHSDHRKYSSQDADKEEDAFVIQAFCIEYTGDEYCVLTNTFTISSYDELKPVNTLPVFPIRFIPDLESFLRSAEKAGNQVINAIENKHATYNAWTVMRTPKGGYVEDSRGVVLKHPEHINGDVMIDFGEAFKAAPNWKPDRQILKPEVMTQTMVSDEFTIRWWSGRDRTKLIRETTEITPRRTGVHNWECNKFVKEDPFLAAVYSNHQRGQLTTKESLSPEDKVLIVCRVFGYVFRERKFSQLDVLKLKPSERTRDALDSLRIRPAAKELIQGSVRGHFLQKEAERRGGEENMSLDIIQGKGTGLFILLHGVPGVGKTATAEAVAQANGKPLFKITCGDLGLTPDKVESSLRDIFRLASIWDCILLMDEVDTFFSQRTRGDSAMTKNALVSVFLRVLDYYTGILFLTTNRPGALDEAFKSRIHYKIYYPALTKEQTIDIWKLNIAQLRRIEEQGKEKRPLEIRDSTILKFAEMQFDGTRNGLGQWNGRQIRNAFQVARSLAYYEAQDNAERLKEEGTDQPPPPAKLEVRHFELMHEITLSFDEYRAEVFGGMTDHDLAHEYEHRADHWKPDRWTRVQRAEDEYDDPFIGYDNVRAQLEGPTTQHFAGRPRSTSHTGHRPSLTVQSGQRYSPGSRIPSFNGPYEDPNTETQSLAVHQIGSPRPRQHRQSLSLEAPAIQLRESSPFDPEYSIVQGSSSNPRYAPSLTVADYRATGRVPGSLGFPRDVRRASDYEGESLYRMDRNDHGKRERV